MRTVTRVLLAVLACSLSAGTGWAQAGGTGTTEARDQGTAGGRKGPARQAPKPPQRGKPVVAARRQPGRPGSLEVSGGVLWLAPGSLGSGAATLTPNAGTSRYTYFDASARAGGAAGIDARATYNVGRRLAVEGGLVYSRPAVSFSISHDAEGVPAFTGEGEKLSQYFVDGNVLLFLSRLSFAGGRGRSFVEGGAGYLRQLHAGNFNVDSGTVYNGGGGFKYYFRPRPKGVVKGVGLRVDLRAYYKRGGFSFDNGNTWTLAFGGGALVAF